MSAKHNVLLLREPDESYTAIIEPPNGVTITVEAHGWRRFKATLRDIGYEVGQVKERDVQDGLGILERAMRP